MAPAQHRGQNLIHNLVLPDEFPVDGNLCLGQPRAKRFDLGNKLGRIGHDIPRKAVI